MGHGAALLVVAGDHGRTDADDVHAVGPVELRRLELVVALVHGVDVAAVCGVVLGEGAVAEVALEAADGEGAGVDDAVDAAEARRLEAVVHAEEVQPEGEVRGVLAAADHVGEVDDAVRLGVHDGLDDVLEVGDVAAEDADAVAEGGVVGRRGVDVHDDDPLPGLDEARDGAPADEARASEHQGGHGQTSVGAKSPAPARLANSGAGSMGAWIAGLRL